MPLEPHSPEFGRLVLRWLDETATADEAERLWRAIAESPECAREFAAASRFESLLDSTVKHRGEAARYAAVEFPLAASRESLRKNPSKPPLGLAYRAVLRFAAAIAALGLVTWMLWPLSSENTVANQHPVTKKQRSQLVSPLMGKTQRSVPEVAVHSVPQAQEKAIPLPARLDTFFLTEVHFDQVPLNQALGLLQGQLRELNYRKTAILDQLRVTVPADAASRPITFHSGPISFLKAAQAIAALAGCDMTVDEPTLALILHREIYPQMPHKRDLREVLASRLNSDGTSALEDPVRIQELLTDAAKLGVTVDLQKPEESLIGLPMTRGQWSALQTLTDARDQLRQMPAPTFQLFYADDNPASSNRVIPQEEVAEMQKNPPNTGGITPQFVQIPLIASNNPPLHSPLSTRPLGEDFEFIVRGTGTSADSPADSSTRLILSAGQGLSLGFATAVNGTVGTLTFMYDATKSGSTSYINISSNTIILLPVVTPPSTSQPPP